MEQFYAKPRCPQCGSEFMVETGDTDICEESKVSCPVHGYLGAAKVVRNRFPGDQPEEFRRQDKEQARKEINEILQKAGLSLD